MLRHHGEMSVSKDQADSSLRPTYKSARTTSFDEISSWGLYELTQRQEMSQSGRVHRVHRGQSLCHSPLLWMIVSETIGKSIIRKPFAA